MEEQKGKISVPVNIRGLEEMPRVHNHVAEFVTSLCKYAVQRTDHSLRKLVTPTTKSNPVFGGHPEYDE